MTGAIAFNPAWLVGAGLNMRIGVKAGSVFEEFLIFLGIFGIPAMVAELLCWKFS